MQKRKLVAMILFIFGATFLFFRDEYFKWENFNDNNAHIYFLNVGQGDSALIKTSKHKLVLIDGGPNRVVIHRLSDILPFWVKRIDVIVASHSHKDHITGLIYVLEKYEIGCVVYDFTDKPISKIDETFRRDIVGRADILRNCDTKDLSLTNYFPVDEIKQRNPNLHYFTVDYDLRDGENLRSVITQFSYGDFDALFTGDAEIPEEEAFIKSFNKDIEIIKIPHHGSRDAFYPPLIIKLTPELGVISVGKNTFGHPHKKTIEGYKSFGVKTLRTDNDDTIHVVSDGINWEVVK